MQIWENKGSAEILMSDVYTASCNVEFSLDYE